MNDPAPPAHLDLDTVPALARAIAEWFPELGGRSIAVTENEITKDNIPTLPLAMVALVNESARQNGRSNANPIIAERIIVEFWFPPSRYRRADGSESPFWAYYSLDHLRSRLLAKLFRWVSPHRARLAYTDGDITADQFAVTISLQCTHEYELCVDDYDLPPESCSPILFSVDMTPFVPPAIVDDSQLPDEPVAGEDCTVFAENGVSFSLDSQDEA